MSHELVRLEASLCNEPILATPDLLVHYLTYLSKRNSGELSKEEILESMELYGSQRKGKREVQYYEDLKVGEISMEGPITYKAHSSLSGGEYLSHQKVLEEAEQLLDQGAETIVLWQNSGGGEAFGTFENSVQLRNLVDDYGAKLIAYVNGMSASASYGYSSVAHEVVMNPDSQVGSIGVVVHLRNVNKALKSVGIEDTFITAGDSKIPFDKEGGWDEGFISRLQERVNALYEDFTQHVAMWRGMDVKDVVDTQAKMFSSKEALELGLADSIMTRKEFQSYLKTENSDLGKSTPESRKTNMLFNKTKEDNPDMAKLEELQTEVAGLTSKLTAKDEELTVLSASVESLQTELTSAQEALVQAEKTIEEMKEAQEETKLQSRKEKVSAVLGTERSAGLEEVYSSLSDEGFDKLLASYQSTVDADQESLMATEIGEEGDPSASNEEPESYTKKLLKAQHQKGDK